MTNAQMRAKLLAIYPGSSWSTRVNKMSDNQVLAAYTRIVNSKKAKDQSK